MHANKRRNIILIYIFKVLDNQPTQADHLGGALNWVYLINKFTLPTLPSDNSRMWLTLTGGHPGDLIVDCLLYFSVSSTNYATALP